MTLVFKLITAAETLPLRQRVLKPFLSLNECTNIGDEAADTFHWAALDNNQIISICTFIRVSHAKLPAETSYQLRGMATAQDFQHRGIGKDLLNFSIQHLENNQVQLLWCNARENAFGFYEKLGFSFLGELFEIPKIGPHKVMYKYLNSR